MGIWSSTSYPATSMKCIDMKMVTNMKKMKKHEKKEISLLKNLYLLITTDFLSNKMLAGWTRSSLPYLPNNDQIIKTSSDKHVKTL